MTGFTKWHFPGKTGPEAEAIPGKVRMFGLARHPEDERLLVVLGQGHQEDPGGGVVVCFEADEFAGVCREIARAVANERAKENN